MSATSPVVRGLTPLAIALTAASAVGSPVVWSVAVGGNGHTYEAVPVPTGVSWLQASVAAAARGGYLATTPTQAEAVFVYSLVSANPALWRLNANNNGYGPWIGAEQPAGSTEPGGGWRWVTSETWSHTRWQSLEPSNYGGGEDAVCYYALGGLMANRWNDLGRGNTFPRSYVIEWSCLGDINHDGVASIQDIFDYLVAYFASLPLADTNGDGAVTVQDIFDYLSAYFGGCP